MNSWSVMKTLKDNGKKLRMAEFGWKEQVKGKMMLSIPDICCDGEQNIQSSRKRDET